MNYEAIRVEVTPEKIGTITLNRPERRNAISIQMRHEISDGFARDLCLTGRKIDAGEAARIGLVSEVVDDDGLIERAIGIAKTIIEAPPETLRFTKEYLAGNPGMGFEESFRVEHDKAFKELLLTRKS